MNSGMISAVDLCDNLENFARKCVENGGELEEWRSEDLCRKLFLHCFYLFEFFILQQNGPICIGAMVKRVESVSDSLIWCLLNVPYSCGLCATCSLQTIDISMSCNLCRSRCREKLLRKGNWRLWMLRGNSLGWKHVCTCGSVWLQVQWTDIWGRSSLESDGACA